MRSSLRHRLFFPYAAILMVFTLLAGTVGYRFVRFEGRNRAQRELSSRLDLVERLILSEQRQLQKSLSLIHPDEPLGSVQFELGLDYLYKTKTKTSGSGLRYLDSSTLSDLGRNLTERAIAFPVDGQQRRAALSMECTVFFPEDKSGNSGWLVGGVVLNQRNDWVDQMRNTVMPSDKENHFSEAAATLYMGTIRIATTLRNGAGARSVGTEMPKKVQRAVYGESGVFSDRVEIDGIDYLTAYHRLTIQGSSNPLGCIAVGIPEKPYRDRERTLLAVFFGLFAVGAAIAFFVALRLSIRLEASERELKNTMEKLTELNKTYLNMVAVVSHDFKNILSSVGLNVNAVADGLYGPVSEPQKSSLALASKSLDYFEKTVKNFLDFVRFEGTSPPVKTEVLTDEAVWLKPALDSYRSTLDSKGMSVKVELPEGFALVADPAQLRLLVNNLLANAVLYTPIKGELKIIGLATSTGAFLRITNSGSSLSGAEQAELFKPFSRNGSRSAEGRSGTGLGLYISRKIAEAHGGTLSYEPKADGNSFLLYLPNL